MKRYKRVLSWLLAVCMALAMLPAMALAADEAASGTCGADGDNLSWELDGEGTLTIRGTGAMKNFSSVSSMLPWYSVRSQIKTVVIEDGVTSIGSYAFIRCKNLTRVTMPDSVTGIGKYAFCYCSALEEVTVPEGVNAIGEEAFSGTPWLAGLGEMAVANGVLLAYQGEGGDVVIPDDVTTIGYAAFQACTAVTSVTIPASVTTIGERAFDNCTGLTSLTIPGTVKEMGSYAFAYCYGLESVTICDGVTEISEGAFCRSDKLTDVTIAGSVTAIGSKAFYNCFILESVVIPEGVTSIGGNAFASCAELTSVTVPASVTYIGSRAFYNSTSLTLSVPEGSYAEAHAQANGIPYRAIPGTEQETVTFTDVPEDEYYAPAVAWAVQNGITVGTGAATFSPEDICTRAQIVTFLYRAAGQPDVDRSGAAKFTDVDLNDYYAPAVAWAVENNITVGTSETEFSPEEYCTRAQIVTFLHRYEDEPEVETANSFTDVAEGEYYAAAVNWAVANKITLGTTEATFSPEEYCTRAQIVTFLYRDMTPTQAA